MKFPLSRKMKVKIGDFLSPFIAIEKDRIAFATKSTVPFGGNLRCVADELLNAGKYDVLIYCDGQINADTRKALEDKGATVRTGFSLSNLKLLLSSEKIFLSHSIRDAHLSTKKAGRTVINLWHGVPIKRIELLMPEIETTDPKKFRLMEKNSKLYDHIIATNENDAKVMSEAFGMSIDKVIKIGLPRFDYMQEDYDMPPDLLQQEKQFLKETRGKKVILYSPTFRESTPSPFTFIDNETIEQLKQFARTNDCVFAIRPHPYDQKAAKKLLNQAGSTFIDASSNSYPETSIILRNTDILITDYSSIWIDFLLKKKPIIGLMPDLHAYMVKERGFLYPFNEIFPGPMLENWTQILQNISSFANINNKNTNEKSYDTKYLAEISDNSINLLLPKYSNNKNNYSIKLTKFLNF